MSNIKKQELRLTAEKAKDNFMPNFMAPTRDLLALLDELEAAEKRIAELEAREVVLPQPAQWDISEVLLDKAKVLKAIRDAGITVKGE